MNKFLNFKDFSDLYLSSQEGTTESLWNTLKRKAEEYNPEGFILLRCIMMDSTRLGERVILPYGPNNTWKTIPDRPVSPRGLCSDMSEVEAIMLSEELTTII